MLMATKNDRKPQLNNNKKHKLAFDSINNIRKMNYLLSLTSIPLYSVRGSKKLYYSKNI
jgi:hypothetical protein